MGALSPTHWLIIIAVVVVLFGARRLPDAARSIGRSARILRAETTGLRQDEARDSSTDHDPKAPGGVGEDRP